MDTGSDITLLLGEARRGDHSAEQRLLELVFGELHRLAAGYMRSERLDHTLQASALVNEAYVRLLGDRNLTWESRAHFYVTAARTMRRILIDHSRRHQSIKKAGTGKVAMEAIPEVAEAPADLPLEDILTLHAALEKLEAADARLARVVELRFFAGLSVEEVAAVMAISPKTVKRDWACARAWLLSRMEERRPD